MLKYFLLVRRDIPRTTCVKAKARNVYIFNFDRHDVLNSVYMHLIRSDYPPRAYPRTYKLWRRL